MVLWDRVSLYCPTDVTIPGREMLIAAMGSIHDKVCDRPSQTHSLRHEVIFHLNGKNRREKREKEKPKEKKKRGFHPTSMTFV